MTREEAIKKIKEAMPTMWKETKEAIQTVIPELFENENERMVRKIESFLSAYGLDYFTKNELLEVENWLEKQKSVPINPDDKHMLERIMALVEFCNDKEIIWSWLCEKVKVAAQMPVEWGKLQEDFRNINEAFEDGKKEVIEHPEKYGLMKDQPPKVNIGHFKSFMMQYLQEAANRKDDSEIEADTDKWAIKLLSLVDAEAVNPVCLDEDAELGLDRALQVVKSARGNLCGYQSDDGIYECDHAIGVLENILNNGIVQKVTEWSEEDEKVIKKVCNFLEANRVKGGLELISMSDITRLSSLRYKYRWKPDDIDMGYLKSIIDRVPLTCREQGALERIYNGLVSH